MGSPEGNDKSSKERVGDLDKRLTTREILAEIHPLLIWGTKIENDIRARDLRLANLQKKSHNLNLSIVANEHVEHTLRNVPLHQEPEESIITLNTLTEIALSVLKLTKSDGCDKNVSPQEDPVQSQQQPNNEVISLDSLEYSVSGTDPNSEAQQLIEMNSAVFATIESQDSNITQSMQPNTGNVTVNVLTNGSHETIDEGRKQTQEMPPLLENFNENHSAPSADEYSKVYFSTLISEASPEMNKLYTPTGEKETPEVSAPPKSGKKSNVKAEPNKEEGKEKSTNRIAEHVVHLRPVQNPDGSITYIFILLDDQGKEIIEKRKGPPLTTKAEAIYLDRDTTIDEFLSVITHSGLR